MSRSKMSLFPPNFYWGVGTSAYQIEGFGDDGRGTSIWDLFCDGKNDNCQGMTAEKACDHLNHLEEDIQLLKALGVNSYRFSVSWPRILPEGTGAINPKGMGFYDRLVDKLLAAGIQPHLTLFHWDYPQALQEQGGWLNEASSDWFADFTSKVVKQLGDRVSVWYTLNEAACFTSLGLHEGTHAPGLKLPFKELLLATKNAMLAHGKAVSAIQMESKIMPTIGLAHVSPYYFTQSGNPKENEVIREETFQINSRSVFKNAWWLDLMINGQIPEEAKEIYKKELPPFTNQDLITIAKPIDFIGLNIYFGHEAVFDEFYNPTYIKQKPGAPHSDSGWPIQPELLYWAPKFFYERYNLPIVIAENGLSNLDWIYRDGHVHDPQRIDYIQKNLIQLKKALDDGIDIRGYFYWSMMDNFEWTEGYNTRFGLIHVDYETQKRTIKDSGYWYHDLIQSNGEILSQNPHKGNHGTNSPNKSI